MKKILGTIWLIIAFVLTLILIKFSYSSDGSINFSLFSLNENMFGLKSRLYETKEYSVNEVKEIQIGGNSEGIEFQKSDDEKIHVEFYCNEKTLPYIYLENGRVTIEPAKTSGINFGKRQILFKIPSSHKLDFVVISGSSGSVKISDCSMKYLTAGTSSGSIKIDYAIVDSCKLHASSGSVKVNNLSAKELLDINTSSGSIKGEGIVTDKLSAKASSGSIKLELKSQLSEDSNIKSSSGSVSLDVPDSSNYMVSFDCSSGSYRNAITGIHGSRGVDKMGSGTVNLSIKTTSGSIKIE